VLVEADPDLVVQTRQAPSNPPSVAVNTGVATQLGGHTVSVCLSEGLLVNGSSKSIGDGGSLALAPDVLITRKGSTYTIARLTGDEIQAQLTGGLINVSVKFGVTNAKQVRGLLGGDGSLETHPLVMRDGEALKEPFSYSDFHRYRRQLASCSSGVDPLQEKSGHAGFSNKADLRRRFRPVRARTRRNNLQAGWGASRAASRRLHVRCERAWPCSRGHFSAAFAADESCQTASVIRVDINPADETVGGIGDRHHR